MSHFSEPLDRTKPPATPPLPSFRLPEVYETRLDNGLRVVLVEDHRFPLFTVRLGFQAGSRFDPEDLPGLSEAVGALLTEGTEARTSRQIAESLAEIGGSLKTASNADTLIVYGGALAEYAATLLELLADVSLNAVFPEDELEIHSNNRLQELLAERSEAAYWANETLAGVIYGSHPYSRLNPTPDSIARLERGTLTGFRDRYLAPGNAVLILLGALPPPGETLQLVASRFGTWRPADAPPPVAAEFPPPGRTVTLVDRPGSVQADIRFGRLAVNRTSPEYFPLLVGNTILGGGASSRLFTNIREEKGYAYDARSALQPRKDAGMFAVVTQVRNEVLEEAVVAVQDEMKRMADEPVSADELANVKNFLSGIFVMGLETQSGVAAQLSTVKLMDLPGDYLEKYTERIRAVQPDEIQEAARKYMAPEAAGIVVVGDASQIAGQAAKFGEVAMRKAE